MSVSTGDSLQNVLTNRRLFVESLGVHVEDVVTARLSHGREVSVFHQERPDNWPLRRLPVRGDPSRTEAGFDSDAVLSDVSGLHVLLTFADCVPIVFADRRRGVVGAAHAGWRGTAQGIAANVVRVMQSQYGSDPGEITVGIGPSIGPCCYEVGPDVATNFESNGESAAFVESGRKLDLWASNRRQLISAGVRADRIENMEICTSCNVDRFFSHRAESGKTGRFALCIGIAKPA